MGNPLPARAPQKWHHLKQNERSDSLSCGTKSSLNGIIPYTTFISIYFILSASIENCMSIIWGQKRNIHSKFPETQTTYVYDSWNHCHLPGKYACALIACISLLSERKPVSKKAIEDAAAPRVPMFCLEMFTLTGGWITHPICIICSSNWIMKPQIGVNIKNIWNQGLLRVYWPPWSLNSPLIRHHLCFYGETSKKRNGFSSSKPFGASWRHSGLRNHFHHLVRKGVSWESKGTSPMSPPLWGL